MTSTIDSDWLEVGLEPVEKHHSPATDLLLGHPESAPPRSLTRALRFSTNNDFFQKPSKPLDSWSASIPRTRAFSMASNARSGSKGKERDVFDPLESDSFASSFALDDMNPFTPKPSRRASLPRPATADSASSPTATSPRRNRGSILGVASDALRFGRRRKSIKALPPLPPQPRLLLPEVIEVRASAPTPTFDEEEEAEREQLRAAAVQSVGFDVNISGPPVREHTAFGDSNEREDHAHANEHEHRHTPPPVLTTGLPPAAADNGISDVPGPTQFVGARGRTSSPAAISAAQPLFALSPTSPQAEMLPFPVTRAQLAVHEQLSATLPKHYPPPSLLMLALSKQWKPRHVVLSAPAPLLTGASYLHIFKSSAPDERELERLEINERSVVFVNDEDVGGRRGVVRVGGIDVGALRRDLNGEENGLTMMMLQIVDANESQNWINTIKNAVLGQRSVNAGLGIPSNSSGAPEPRGDLDVMLSMRMQGILPSPVKPTFSSAEDTNKPQQNGSSEEVTATSQPPSMRSRPASPRPQTGVLSLKSLFSVSGSGSTRPRSPSSPRATSPDAPSSDSFGSAASSLLGRRKVADSPLIKPYSMLPPTGPALDLAAQLQRKIIDTQANLDLAPLENSSKSYHSILPSSRPMSPSLNPPPPRKRSNTTTNEPFQAPYSPDPVRLVYNHGNASTAGSFGVPVPEATRPPSERAYSERGKPRAGSVSTTSTETESGSGRRCSRPSSILPRPMSSDTDDLSTPVAVVPQPTMWQNGVLPSYDPDRASHSSSQSQKTLPSVISSLQVASKRTSTSSSVHSVATANSNQHFGMFSIARSGASSHRMSVPPPPRPAPSMALPPTPTGSDSESSATSPPATLKPIRRNSLARRALRLSLGQAPPSMQVQAQLSPRVTGGFNTTSTFRLHSRSTSVDSVPRSALSHGHVIPSALLVPPTPPPTGPLPPPPLVIPTPTPTPAPLPSVPRTSSFKQRLRILSAPSGRSTPPPPSIATVVPPALSALEIPTSIPPTQIGERIAHIAPDADFLHLEGDTPVATAPPRAPFFEDGTGDDRVALSQFSFPLPPRLPSRGSYRPPLPPVPDRSPQQMTVLSPPPRKGSIRPLPSPSPEQERGPSAARDDEDMLPLTPPPLDLARNTSTLSLSIVSGAV